MLIGCSFQIFWLWNITRCIDQASQLTRNLFRKQNKINKHIFVLLFETLNIQRFDGIDHVLHLLNICTNFVQPFVNYLTVQ